VEDSRWPKMLSIRTDTLEQSALQSFELRIKRPPPRHHFLERGQKLLSVRIAGLPVSRGLSRTRLVIGGVRPCISQPARPPRFENVQFYLRGLDELLREARVSGRNIANAIEA
jgi:hypothetical protein